MENAVVNIIKMHQNEKKFNKNFTFSSKVNFFVYILCIKNSNFLNSQLAISDFTVLLFSQ